MLKAIGGIRCFLMLYRQRLSTHLSESKSLLQHIFFLLQSCESIKEILQIHTQIVVNGFIQNNFILSKLLWSYVGSGKLFDAYQAFKLAETTSIPVWNQMIRGFARSTLPEKSLYFYREMQRTGYEADSHTYSELLIACSSPGLDKEGQEIHGLVISRGFYSSPFIQTNLINMYCRNGRGLDAARQVFDEISNPSVVAWNAMTSEYLKSGNFDAARKLFDEMPERNVVSWTTLIMGCSRIGRCKDALALFYRMRRLGVEADQVTLIAVLSACAKMGDLNMGKKIHSLVDRVLTLERTFAGNSQKCQQLVSLDNAIIRMYYMCGDIEKAHRLFEEMPQRNLLSWTTMITGFAIHGRAKDAINLFWQMQRNEPAVSPDGITFIGLLSACNLAGLVKEGRSFFELMNRVFHIKPRVMHYVCMVDLYSRAGQLGEAMHLMLTMPIVPNEVMWGSILHSCKIHHHAELASVAAYHLLALGPNRFAGYLSLLSNIYASLGRLDRAIVTRQKMIVLGVNKPIGYSWIQVNGTIHEFAAGDRSHPRSKAVYEMVAEIWRKAELEGYKTDNTSESFFHVEEEEKEGFRHLHSEKLAIAFGLITVTDPSEPIRITKNFKICLDCHSLAKLVSRIFNREISIRERNRFHHFNGGSCSCHDYW